MSYQGSYMFKFVADKAGLPVDQFNFLFSQLIAITVGLVFRARLKPCPQNTLRRHLISILIGIILGHFCYGRQMWHLFFQAFIVFLALEFCPRKYVHLFTFVFSMGYLSALHIYRLIYDYGNYTLDITGAVMISTQKLTSLAFAYYDGMRSADKLNADQKLQVISQKPHIIEFLSYIFNFQGVIVGPLCFYKDYIDFINGNNILKMKKNGEVVSKIEEQPSVLFILVKKLVITAVLGILFFKITLAYPLATSLSEEILNKPLWFRIPYYYVSAGSQRIKYYLAWVLADAVNNASGLGFNGYDDNGNPKWDLVTNIRILDLELSTSVKSIFDHWNIQTQTWFRRIAYDRLHTGKTLGVFVLSALWHGFYPGYYMTFVLCAFMVYAGRGIRRKVRPFFQTNKFLTIFYSIITWLGTMWSVNYAAASFDLLGFWKSVGFYNTWYWFWHILVIAFALVLPGGSTKTKKVNTGEEKKPNDNKSESLKKE